MTQLDALKQHSLIVADTGDLDAIRRYQPQDATTNPSLILKAFGLEGQQHLIDATLSKLKNERSDPQVRTEKAVDRLSVVLGTEIAGMIPGRVSTEVPARLSFDTAASIRKAHDLIADYDRHGIGPERVLIKLAATWEGIRAAERLERDGIQCNLTLLFSDAQAQACLDAGVFLVSPFVGRVTDWYRQQTGEHYTPDTDPGVRFVQSVCKRVEAGGFNTVAMGASFRTTAQVLALAGCNRLTISPALLEQLAASDGDAPPRIHRRHGSLQRPAPMTEPDFRWGHNEDPMATDKLAEGIRRFASDQSELERLIAERLTG